MSSGGRGPGPVMVWTPAQTGSFLDFIAEERSYALSPRSLSAGCVVPRSRTWLGPTPTCRAQLTVRETSPGTEDPGDEYDDTKSEAGERTVALDEATMAVLLDWRARQERETRVGPEVRVDSGRVFTREDGARPRPQWISTRFEDLIKKYGLVRHRHSVEDCQPDRRCHRLSDRTVQAAIAGDPLPPIRFHDLRHGAATLALLGNVNMKVISETLGHARPSFTADTYTSVLPEVSKEAVAAVVHRRPQAGTPAAANVISFADRRNRRGEHAG
ncbi:tyrosine-type recombinase/integrase [Actinomadura sp. WMMB 499]|uniref:tyrosine-type recombinase/integrase n=1 Tax=Actinomadura sp. WMMB 499 TaxID=1219491 RepID=UPI001243BA81|nr:tyrosine-type recombinase/integrase [Actinomadura sp. WMMB 499]QFG22915.1 tyrosine-type recombinase/integrase [Actinomadura sp. WMMB 499]